MVSIGGQTRPYVGDAVVQNISGGISLSITPAANLIANSSGFFGNSGLGIGFGSGGIGASVSGTVASSIDGMLEFNLSGNKIWIPYWVSG